MRLYHLTLFLLAVSLLAACTPPQVTQEVIQITVLSHDGSQTVQIAAGSSAQAVIEAAGITLDELDRMEPPAYTVMTDGGQVRIIRVEETFEIEQVTIPFERQTLRNESLPAGESRLVQAGVNGLQELTYRTVLEDGIETGRIPVKSVTVQEAIPEILMVGSQTPYATFGIPGKLVYLVGGNAWMMEGDTANRRPLITTADLDGRVFSLSADGEWLLFSRKSEEENQINTLWVAHIAEGQEPRELDLQAQNVVHFADWVPGANRVAYSTVEPRAAAPGWQANNDLWYVSFSPTTGWVGRPVEVVEANTGGVYGWWGTHYVFGGEASRLAFARPDGIGLVDLADGSLTKVLDITPFQTFGDWAWVPGLSWSQDGQVLYTVQHAPEGAGETSETSPWFDMAAVSLAGGVPVSLVEQAGMFAYPSPSPAIETGMGEQSFKLAYLEAIIPNQSKDSKYRLMLADRDGSNRQIIFPLDDAGGIDPQRVYWSPDMMPGMDAYAVTYLNQGNLWIVLPGSAPQQVTGDGLVVKIDWK